MGSSPFFDVVMIAGGLGLFLHGLEFTARAFRKSLGKSARQVMGNLSRHKGLSFFFGMLLSFLSQSSTAATSFAVGLVDAGILPFASSLVVMMSASVGTTFVVLLLSLDIVGYSPLLLAAGVVMTRSGREGLLRTGYVLQGISLVLLGMLLVNQGVVPLSQEPFFRSLLLHAAGNSLVLAAAAFLVTSVVQSSVPVVALTIALTTAGLFPLDAVLPLILGTHVGSSTTVLLPGIGGRRNARVLALCTFYFKLAGALLILPVSDMVVEGVSSLSRIPGLQVAYVQVFVAWFNALVMLPFSGLLACWSQRFFGRGRRGSLGDPLYLDPRSIPLAPLAVRLLAKEMIRLAMHLEELIFHCLRSDCRQQGERVRELRTGIRQLSQVCTEYLVGIPAPMDMGEPDEEYASISYSLAAMRDIVEITAAKLTPLCLKTGCSPEPFADFPEEWQSFKAALQGLVGDSLGVFALGGADMICRVRDSFENFSKAEAAMRMRLVSRGFYVDSENEIDAWDFLSISAGIARGCRELARGGALNELERNLSEQTDLRKASGKGGFINVV